METLLEFFKNYGLPITIIAVVGIVVLGILKYCNLFKKIAENKRHYIYFAISVGLSVLATIIYLLIVKQFAAGYVVAIALAIYALNQTFYNIKGSPKNHGNHKNKCDIATAAITNKLLCICDMEYRKKVSSLLYIYSPPPENPKGIIFTKK